jgi:hypothetical protein
MKDGDVVIFRNDKKEGKQPEYTGKCQINGVMHNVSLWVKDGAKGKFFSGRIEQWVEKIQSKPAKEVESDDLPF